MNSGGFGVIIGNPPWKEYASVRRDYQVKGFTTEDCGNLHGICTERALMLRSSRGRMSFIVQLPLTCSSRMKSVRALLQEKSRNLHVVPFDDRPGKLFDGLQHCRSVIFLSDADQSGSCDLITTRYQRWPTESRAVLFSQFEYARASGIGLYPGLFAKFATDEEVAIFKKVKTNSDKTLGKVAPAVPTESFVFYQEATQYWVKSAIGIPYYAKDGTVGAPAHGRYAYFVDQNQAAIAFAILNSNLFYSYFIAYGDCFHLSDTLVTGFPIPSKVMADKRLMELGNALNRALIKSAVTKSIRTRDGSTIEYAEYFASESKAIIDDIDLELGRYYGLTSAELDFIINYDIKYRMGQEDADDAE